MTNLDAAELGKGLATISSKRKKKASQRNRNRRKQAGGSNRLEAQEFRAAGYDASGNNNKSLYGESEKGEQKRELSKEHDDSQGKEPVIDDKHDKDDDGHQDDDDKYPHPPKPPGPNPPDPPEPPGPNPPEPPGPNPPEPPGPQPDDPITEAQIRARLSGLFRRQFAFADSYSDYGSRAALLQQTIGASAVPPVQPVWSGVTFSNANFNWQIGLQRNLGIETPTVEIPGLPATPFYALANPFIGQLPAVPNGGGSSYAIGGATTGTLNLFELLTPEGANEADIAGTGIQSQLLTALELDNIELDSRTLSIIWGGGNDLLVGERSGADLTSTFRAILEQLRDDLIALVRNGGARQVMLAALGPLQGLVDGVPYQTPFLTGLIAKAEAAPSDSYLKEWLNLIRNGGIQDFQASVLAMVEEVQAMYPYTNLMGLIPEYEAFSREFGKAYGSFSNYGINNTLSYAQLSGITTNEETNSFLYFDPVHPTQSGQVMLERGIELTLIREKDAIHMSTLSNFQTGDNQDNILTGGIDNDDIRGRGGKDQIRGRKGWDDLRGDDGDDRLWGGLGNDKIDGGLGSDELEGGQGSDFFQFNRRDANGKDVDVIVDFKPEQGDRLGIATVTNNSKLFEGSQWIYIGSNEFTGTADELRFSGNMLSGDIDGDGKADLQIRLKGLETFDPEWIS